MVKGTVTKKAHLTFLKQGASIQDVKCALSVMTRVQALAHMTSHVIGHVKITNIGLIGVNTNICQKVERQVTPPSLGLGHLGDIGSTTPKVVRHQSTMQENLNLDFTLVTHQANQTKCPIMDIMLVIMAILSSCLKICALMGRETGQLLNKSLRAKGGLVSGLMAKVGTTLIGA
ncbi:hypothetical protein DPMN_072428 [Dreissena polymorpha]|uniref:Uncharacterized protein n=1 Tax=Dreissena polymorpha TaxID=45954 RepID=A0A9D3Z8N8_DREPO|nr:hypothetical protein DPMN_072428 [Dreissena polymorpha]